MKSLHLAGLDDVDRILPLVAAHHSERGHGSDAEHRAQALAPLLEGSPHGAVWLIGPRKAPVGYVVVTFGWSVSSGGLEAVIDEIYIRPAVRGRGMGGDALDGIAKALREAGVRVLHLQVDREDSKALRFYQRARFAPRDGYLLMSRPLG